MQTKQVQRHAAPLVMAAHTLSADQVNLQTSASNSAITVSMSMGVSFILTQDVSDDYGHGCCDALVFCASMVGFVDGTDVPFLFTSTVSTEPVGFVYWRGFRQGVPVGHAEVTLATHPGSAVVSSGAGNGNCSQFCRKRGGGASKPVPLKRQLLPSKVKTSLRERSEN
jgi:hypothetical protein